MRRFKWATDLASGALSALASKLDIPLEETIKFFTQQHECAHLMKVNGVSTLSYHNIERCESSVFHDYGYKWKLVFCQRGKDSNKKISLYVELEDAASLPVDRLIIVDLQFFLVSLSAPVSFSRDLDGVIFNLSNPVRGVENLRSLEILSTSKFLVNDSLIVGFEIKNMHHGRRPKVSRPVGTVESLMFIEKPPNNKFTWKITKFSTFKQVSHHSDPTVVGQRKWVIQISPKGMLDGYGNSLSVFLKPIGYLEKAPRATTLGKYSLRVLNQLGGAHLEYGFVSLFGPSSPGVGKCQFLPFKDLYDKSKGFLVNDVIYIGVEFQVISVTESL